MTYVIVGTGVGSATVLDGQLLRGYNNSAGEIGHVPLDRDGEVCSCGSRGCVETFISGPWLVRRYLKKAQIAGSVPPPRGRTAIDGEILHTSEVETGQAEPFRRAAGLTAVDIVNLALEGDRLAQQVMQEAGAALGAAIATLAMVLDVDLFVVGGSVVKSGDLLLEPARRALPDHCYRSVGCGVRIVATELGDDGPLLGCARMAREALANARAECAASRAVGDLGPGTPARLPERARLEKVEGIIFNVQRFSVHDGPGLRTDVFFKGCPLRCAWCANPESHRFQPELALSVHQCICCGQFDDVCSHSWSHGAITQLEKDNFGQRAEACPGGALRWLGERRTAGDVLAEVLRDRPFYPPRGGLTLTGGEPTAQPEFAEALLRLAKAEGLTTAIETSGHTRWKVFERLLPHLDLILFELKQLDSAVHHRGTGVDNELILSNLRRLCELRAPVDVRVPLIPGFNADPESLAAIAHFIVAQDGLRRHVSLLPYHTLGKAKYAALGRPYPWDGHETLSTEQVESLAELFRQSGIDVAIGS